jgi:hypothetical protein
MGRIVRPDHHEPQWVKLFQASLRMSTNKETYKRRSHGNSGISNHALPQINQRLQKSNKTDHRWPVACYGYVNKTSAELVQIEMLR